MSTVNENGSPVLVEYGYYRHFNKYLAEAESIEDALRSIEYGEDAGQMSSVGVFVDGEPRVWDGFVDKDPPTTEQAEKMRRFYGEAERLP
jgi:hypothetical protein